jgi:hypothetical protein
MVARRSTEVTGLMGSESSVPSLFSGQTGASTVVGTNMGNNLSCLGPRIDEQMASNDPLRMVIRFPVIRTGQVAVWVFLRVEYQRLQQQCLHTHLLVLVYVVLVLIGLSQQPRLVLA